MPIIQRTFQYEQTRSYNMKVKQRFITQDRLGINNFANKLSNLRWHILHENDDPFPAIVKF